MDSGKPYGPAKASNHDCSRGSIGRIPRADDRSYDHAGFHRHGFAWAVLVAVLVVSVAFVGVATATPAAASAIPSTPAPAAVQAPKPLGGVGLTDLAQRVATDMKSNSLPKGDWLFPNLAYSSVREGAAVVPSNVAQGGVQPGPTSIGVNDLGLRINSKGQFVPYSYRTTSLVGTISINNITLLPIENNASSSITLQLNAVLNNVTIYGQSIYQIWAQNVIFYSVAGDQMQLATDGWNFTGPPFELFPNDLYAHSPGGFIFTGTYVHAVPSHPPAFTLRPPFSISFYLNSTNVGGRNALYFNYSVSSAYDITLGHHNYGRTISDGSFDWMIFNSTAGMPAGYRAPPASFLISGNQPTNLGLPNDAEIAICGGSDGFGGIAYALNATAQLQYLSAKSGTYEGVPAAFTTTEDTGETMEGVNEHFSPASAREGLAYLTNGPEYIYGLWNATPAAIQEKEFSVSATPSSTLVWVSPRGKDGLAFNESLAAWDLSPTASSTFWLPTGPGQTFEMEAMANDYAPRVLGISPGTVTHVGLRADLAEGLYAPVIAFGNAAVASIAKSGDGTAQDPYIIAYSQTQPISSLYSVYEDYTEPYYPGLLLSGVTAHVVIEDPPSFYIELSAEAKGILVTFWNLSVPNVNYLPIEIYDSSNISIVGAAKITGWFPVTLTGFLMASLFLSNDTHVLVAHDQFSSMGSAMVIVSPNGNRTAEQNTVFGNTFVSNSLVHGPDASSLYVVLAFNTTYTGPPAVGGLGVFSSGNTIYNNLFETPITAYSPPQNPYLAYVYINDFGYTDYASVASVWQNHWNIPLAPTSYVRTVNGFALTGSIVGAPFQGGNAWTNWNGVTPYTDAGLIVAGGDAWPLPTPGSGIYAVVFEEKGLPSGTAWTVWIARSVHHSQNGLVVAYEVAGTYPFTVPNRAGLVAHPGSGSFTVSASDLVVLIRFS